MAVTIEEVLGGPVSPVKTEPATQIQKTEIPGLPVSQTSAADELRALSKEKTDLDSRDANDFVADQVTGAASAFVGLVGGGIGATISGVGALSQYAGKDGGTLDNFGKAASKYAVDYTQTANKAVEFIRSGQSETKSENARINAQMGAIQSAQNAIDYEESVANGDSAFIADLVLVGKNALDTTKRVLSDPLATEAVFVESLGSLGPSAKVASAAVKVASNVAAKLGVREGTGLAVAEIVGSSLGTGLIEGTGTYSQTVNTVMERTPEEMMTSPMYRELLSQNVDPVEAQKQVADATGMDAFRINLPMAIASGVISSKFNANPIAAFEGKGIMAGLADVGAETFEEMSQGGASQIAQNLAMADRVDDKIRLSDDVGEQIALGAIGGAGVSAALGAGTSIGNSIAMAEDRAQAARDEQSFVQGMGEQIAAQRRADVRTNMTPEERNAEVRSSMNQNLPGEDLFNSVVNKGSQVIDTIKETAQGITGSGVVSGAIETFKGGVQAVKEAAAPVVNQVIKAAQDYNEKGNPVVQNETVAAAESVVKDVLDPAVETGTLGVADTTVKKDSLPEIFKDTVAEGSSIADTMTSIVKTISDKRVAISSMTDDAVLFVTQKFNEMQNAASTLAPEVKEKIKKVLASPDLERIRKRAARLDLNTAVSPAIEKVSSTVRAMTVAVSKINPTNVNPHVVDKILKQENRGDMTPEEIQSMEIAASVARPLNAYKENIVKIADEKYQALVASGAKPVKSETNVEQVSRNLIVGNLSGENKVPSINETANRIIIGMQSPDQSVEIDGVRVPVKTVAASLRKLGQHMINKVNALNESFDNNDEKGVGPYVNHDTLVRGTDFILAGQAGSKTVNYSKRSVNSVTFAKTVAADAAVLAEVHNALVKAYPDQFPDGLIVVPVLKTVENQNTTAVEEVSAQPKLIENAKTTQEGLPEETPETTAVEDATPVASETIVMDLTQEKADAMNDEELIASVNSWEPSVQSTLMEQGRVNSIMAIMDPLIAPLGLPNNIIRLLAWMKSDSKTHLGQAYWAERVISLAPSAVRKIMNKEEAGGIHIFFHELFHVIDAKASNKFGRTASMDALEFDLLNGGGEVYDEVKTLSDSDPEMKEYFRYAFSFSTPEEVASELFAEIGAMMMLMDRETARSLLPKGVAYVEQIVEQAGGVKASEIQTDGNSTSDTDITSESDAEVIESKVNERFVSVFRPKKKEAKAKTAKEILGLIEEQPGTENYRLFANVLLDRISKAMNKRLETVPFSTKDPRSVLEVLRSEPDTILANRDHKPLLLVDPQTGRYNQELLDLASMAVIDWLTTARPYGADRLSDMLEELGLTSDEVDDNQIRDLLNSVPTRTTSEGLAKKVIKLWNVQVNKEAQMVEIRGTTEGLVKEIFTVLSQMEDPLVRIIELKTAEGRTASFEISALREEQEDIGLNAVGSLDKVLFPEDQIMASFGKRITHVPKTQNNKDDVPLSAMEQKAIKNMQDTAHTEAMPVVNFFAALGLDSWARMAGKKDSSALAKRHPLRLTIEGKNTSIERDYVTAFQMVTAADGREVFYPVGVTNVGRHQMKGINPQNNKLLRAMMTPTHSKLDMANNQKHKNAFWLTVAQSSGLAKVEKKMHSKILATIQEDFAAKFGEATAIALAFLETGSMDSEAFTDAMLKATKYEEVSVAQVNAVLAVARLQEAQKAGTLEFFETSLSFELDGKTDGPANMMVGLGQGLMTRLEYQNFKRVGLFLGSKGETLNSLFSDGEVDLYEVNSTFADRRMSEMILSAKGLDKKRLMALQRFAGHFGDFVINPDGSIQMSRNTSKNPMTKKVYGSGENGIAEGIAQDMLVNFYTKLIALNDGVSVQDHLNYQEINGDLDLLFGTKLPEVLDVNRFILPNAKMKPFAEFVKETIGTILSQSINEVMSQKTIDVNDLMVFSTGVQGEFMKLFFEQRLAEAMAELSEEYGDSDNQKNGKPTLRKMSQATYDAIVKETLAFAPYLQDRNQNLRIGDFSGQQDKTEMSSNMNGNIRAKSTMQKPDKLGVKVIPYVIQGRGDAMMMNRIFSAENAPKKAIPIFDGIDMAINDFDGLSDQINEAVLSNWDNDVLGPVVQNYNDFLAKVEKESLNDKLQMAFDIVKEASKKKSSVTALDHFELGYKLAEVHRLNQVRRAVFKRIALAVDHMGGSGKAFIRNYEGEDLTFEQINEQIQNEIDGVAPAVPVGLPAPEVDPFEGVEDAEIVEPVVVTDVATVVDALIRETKPHLREVIRAIRNMMPDDARIVMGTEKQIAQWRKDNLGQKQSKTLDQKTNGFYDVDNNIIFIISDNQETIVHEMIHMATFQAVLDHYQGTKKSTAVKNLEVLMEEFLSLDTITMSPEAQEVYFDAKRAIVLNKAEATQMGDAMALNEFMAWTLASSALMKELKQTPTTLINRLTKAAKAWIQRILGVVPFDMYGSILFNTQMIRNEEFPDGFDDGTPPIPQTDNSGVTPLADAFTNFWIDRLRDALEMSKTPDGKNTQDKLIRYIETADNALVKLDFGGFALSEYQKKTFVAIHAVIAAEIRLDPNALIALGKVYEHITNSLTPQMFGKGQAAQDRYSAVMELMGATKNDQGISDAIAVLLALSQTSTAFRKAMDQIPQPAAQPGIQTSSLNDLLTSTTGFLMQKMIATTDTEGKGVKEILDALSDQILRQDDQNEFRALKSLMGTFNKADAFVGGALSLLAQKTREINREVQASQTNGILKVVSGSVALATSFMDKDTSAQAGKGAKNATHMDGMLDSAVFIRELIAEIVGADAVNSDTIQMLDKVTYVVQSTRQAYREELPVVLQNEFKTHPTADQWKALHWVLGKSDFASLFDLKNPDESFDMLNDQNLLDRRIKTREAKILKTFPGQDGKNILLKAQQLADYINGKGAGFQLFKNAYAIHKLIVGNSKPNMVTEIDKLVSLYVLNGTDIAQREAVAAMQASDPDGVHNLLVYVQALNKEEDQKIVSEAARMNGYKGYIPDHGQGEVSLINARDSERENLQKRGYIRVADDTTDASSLISRGYYMTTVKQSGNYSQGVLQQVQDTYRGVNATTGLTVNGTVSGVISGVAVVTITDALNQSFSVSDPKNVLIPVYDQNGGVLYYERAINPDLREKYLQPESNMALMVGVWAGRQVEEKFSHEYNKALVQKLKEIWDKKEPNSEGLFIRMDQAKDKIYADSWGVIPPQLKEHIFGVFGEDTGFMVRKDMINLALGYRDPSVVDVWTGNNRLPESVELAVKTIGKMTMGDKAFKWLANSESFTMNSISTAKDMIVVRSLVVPFMNTQSNVFQLVNRGVGTKQIMRGYKEKFAEIEKLNQNLKKIMGLQARVRLAATDKNKAAILKQQIQVLEDENERFSVSPLVKEGAYKNISEGITELDVSITDGKFGDWVESQLNRLPTGVQTVAKYGLLSKDTALYKGANKAVQYGDFVAKSILYDDLRAKSLTHDAAMVKVNEEFINFSLLPGRTRTYMESMGATWFLTFKIRSMKVALQMMRENPVRSLSAVGVFGLEAGPMTDNLAVKAIEGTLPYSLGWDMLWDAPSINPWVSVTGL